MRRAIISACLSLGIFSGTLLLHSQCICLAQEVEAVGTVSLAATSPDSAADRLISDRQYTIRCQVVEIPVEALRKPDSGSLPKTLLHRLKQVNSNETGVFILRMEEASQLRSYIQKVEDRRVLADPCIATPAGRTATVDSCGEIKLESDDKRAPSSRTYWTGIKLDAYVAPLNKREVRLKLVMDLAWEKFGEPGLLQKPKRIGRTQESFFLEETLTPDAAIVQYEPGDSHNSGRTTRLIIASVERVQSGE